jgi:heme/copper-type cytochrome/quinol oxidase subunit 4
MKKISSRRVKQLIVLFIFSLGASLIAIIHGVFFDLNFAEIKRLTLFGFIATVLVIFPTILLIEWLFDWNNGEEIRRLEERIEMLEDKKVDF